jgi:CRISPR system Cascade subunit CasD
VLAVSEFLLFTLHAPLASWGEIAVGENRGSWDRPSRSAVLGLVAAALGLTREAQAEHDTLDAGYGVAVRLDAPGTPLVDYHTAQTMAASVARRQGVTTRARLLAVGNPQTILSRRAYCQDAVATVALWTREGEAWSLAELANALRRPAFILYAGRKANALGLPLAPEVIPAATLAEAFERRSATQGLREDAPSAAREALHRIWSALRPTDGWGREVAHDAWDRGSTGLQPVRREVRRDTAPHRGRWHFSERIVEVGLLPAVSDQGGVP